MTQGGRLCVCGRQRGQAKLSAMWDLFKEFLQFLREEKKWWLVPLVVLLVALAALLVFGSSSGIAWAIYPFM